MWLNMASDAGNAEAELDLGHYFWLKEDYNVYIKHTSRAAEMGCPEAFEELSKAYCCAIGRFYGLDYDFEKAILFKRLALQADYDSWIPILVSYGYKVTE
jgi:TPR repeat protein